MPTAFLDRDDRTLDVAQKAFRNTDIRGWRPREVESVLESCRGELSETLKTLRRTRSFRERPTMEDGALEATSRRVARDHLTAIARQREGSKIIKPVDVSGAEWLLSANTNANGVSKRRAYLAELMHQVLEAEELEGEGGIMVRSSNIEFIRGYLNGDRISRILRKHQIRMGDERIETVFTDARRGGIMRNAKNPELSTVTYARNLNRLRGTTLIRDIFAEHGIRLSRNECEDWFTTGIKENMVFNSLDVDGVLDRVAGHVASTLTNGNILNELMRHGIEVTDFDLNRRLPPDQRVKIATRFTANPMQAVVRIFGGGTAKARGKDAVSGPRATEALDDDLQEAG